MTKLVEKRRQPINKERVINISKIKFKGVIASDGYTTFEIENTESGYRVLIGGKEIPNVIGYSVEFGSGIPKVHLTIAPDEIETSQPTAHLHKKGGKKNAKKFNRQRRRVRKHI